MTYNVFGGTLNLTQLQLMLLLLLLLLLLQVSCDGSKLCIIGDYSASEHVKVLMHMYDYCCSP